MSIATFFRQDERLATRGQIKRQLAELSIIEAEAADTQDRILAIDEEDERLASSHQTLCQKLQPQIAKLEKSAIDEISLGQPVPETVGQKLRDLRQQVDDANFALEKALADNQLRRCKLKDQLRKLRLQTISSVQLRRRLQTAPLGRPDLLAANFAADKSVEWGTKRQSEADHKLQELRELQEQMQAHDQQAHQARRDPSLAELVSLTPMPRGDGNEQQVAALQPQINLWAAEAAEAARQIAEAKERAKNILDQLLDE